MGRTSRCSAALGIGLAVLLSAEPALAHPFGPPPTALVRADGEHVHIEWRAAPDDAIAVGVEIGLLPEDLIDGYLEAPAQVAPAEADELALSQSEALRDYLLEHIAVQQDGVRCSPRLEPIGNFVHEGAHTIHECPARVDVVDIAITVLHARHPAYRTFAISGDAEVNPQQAVFTVEDPEHRWDFAAERASVAGTGAVGLWPLALAVLGALAVAGVVLSGRRQRDGGPSLPS